MQSSDLNTIYTYLFASVRMAQELNYQNDSLDDDNINHMKKEIDKLQEQLSLLNANKDVSDINDKIGDKELELPMKNGCQNVVIDQINEGNSQPEMQIPFSCPPDKPHVFLHVRPMNSLEKSKRSRNSMKYQTEEGKIPCLYIDDPVEGEYTFEFNSGIFKTENDVIIDPLFYEAVISSNEGSQDMPHTTFLIMGSHGSRSESVLLGSDYNTIIDERGDMNEMLTESLLGQIFQHYTKEESFQLSYLCFSKNHVILRGSPRRFFRGFKPCEMSFQ